MMRPKWLGGTTVAFRGQEDTNMCHHARGDAMRKRSKSFLNNRMRSTIALCFSLALLAFWPVARAHAATFTVSTGSDPQVNGDNFQAALNSAQCGDTIILQAGATYETRTSFVSSSGPQGNPFTLPNKGNCNAQYITIQSSAAASLPAGVRVTPAQAANLATIRTSSSAPAIAPALSAGWYQFIGIEFTNSSNVPANGGNVPILFGPPNLGYFSYGQWAHHIIVDRSWFHPYEETADPTSNLRSASSGIQLEGVELTVQNSYCSGFMGFQANAPTVPAQSQCILSVAGPGPLHIINNFLEAWYSNIFTGGGGSSTQNMATLSAGATSTQATFSQVANLQVGDLVALQMPAPFTNLAGVPSSWGVAQVTAISGTVVTYAGYGPDAIPSPPAVPGQATWRGTNVSGLEVRNNTLSKRSGWETGGFGIAKSYWEMKSGMNVVFDGNIVQGPPGAAPINAGFQRNQDGSTPWIQCKNIQFTNNLLRGIGAIIISFNDPYHSTLPGGNLTLSNNLIDNAPKFQFILAGGGSNWIITHNTVRGNTNSIMMNDGDGPIDAMTFRDNITLSGGYWFNGGPNDFPNKTEDHNVIVNTSGSPPPSYTSGDFVVSSATAVGFVNVGSADAGGDYHGYALASTSSFKGRASDGTDPGVNFEALDAALSSSSSSTGPPAAPMNLRVP